jgi:hypothetical protein
LYDVELLDEVFIPFLLTLTLPDTLYPDLVFRFDEVKAFIAQA